MAELKTKENNASVTEFINKVEPEKRRMDAKELLKIFKKATGKRPKMWGDSIIGYGKYHYKHERSTQEGDWPLTGFSPRKARLSLYIMPGFNNDKIKKHLNKLGKHKTSVGCLYIKKLEDVDTNVLIELIKDSVDIMKEQYEVYS